MKIASIWLATLLCLGWCINAESQEAAEIQEAPAQLVRYGLFIGSNDGGPERPNLRYAETDAERVAGLMRQMGGLTPSRTVVLLNPTPDEVHEHLEQFGEWIGQQNTRSELIVYYSGHSDEQGLLLRGQRLGYSALKKALGTIASDVQVVILDSCSSGGLLRARGGTHKPAFMVDKSADVQGRALLTSSSIDEAAQESDNLQGGLFTHYLMSGLRGAADTSQDGRVSLNEIYQFAFNETLNRSQKTLNGPQHAAFDLQLTGTGDLVLTELQATGATLLLDDTIEGRLFIRDDTGALVVETRKPPGVSISLGLAPGRYKVTLLHNDQHHQAQVNLGKGHPTTLRMSHFTHVAADRMEARGHSYRAQEQIEEARFAAAKARFKAAVMRETLQAMHAGEHPPSPPEPPPVPSQYAAQSAIGFYPTQPVGLALDAGAEWVSLPGAEGQVWTMGAHLDMPRLSLQWRLKLPMGNESLKLAQSELFADTQIVDTYIYGTQLSVMFNLLQVHSLVIKSGFYTGFESIRHQSSLKSTEGPQNLKEDHSVVQAGFAMQSHIFFTHNIAIYANWNVGWGWRQGKFLAGTDDEGDTIRQTYEPGVLHTVGAGALLRFP